MTRMTGSSGNLTENVPGISNDRDLEHFSDMLEALDRIERRLTPEERPLEALLSRLIEDYDDRIELPEAPPHRVVAFLMEQKGLRPVDMTPVFGLRSVTSDVLSGKREFSKNHIRKLADFFHLSPAVFF